MTLNQSARIIFSCIIFYLFFFIPANLESATDIVFIANKNVGADTLTQTDIKNIFLGVMRKWPDQKKINFAVLNINSQDVAVHETFTKKYTHKTTGQFQRYWRNQLFTGNQKMPPICRNEKEMIRFVESQDGAIGYVSSSAPIQNVKVITVTEK